VLVNIELRLRRLIPFTSLALFLDSGDDMVRVGHAAGKHSDTLRGYSLGYGKGISGWVAAYRKPILNSSPALEFQGDPDFASLVDTLIVPMELDGECLGTISLYSETRFVYTKAHLALAQAAAAITAPMLDTVRRREVSGGTAVHDPATGAYRASYLHAAAFPMIAAAEQGPSGFALGYLTIRNLEDMRGLHGGTDPLLARVATIMRGQLRSDDILGRFGPDAFVVLLAGQGAESASECMQAIKWRVETAAGTELPGALLPDCVVSVASYPKDGTTLVELLEHAQAAITRPAPRAAAMVVPLRRA
jgi:diguanylate cyclase (GGDEF)-like protein